MIPLDLKKERENHTDVTVLLVHKCYQDIDQTLFALYQRKWKQQSIPKNQWISKLLQIQHESSAENKYKDKTTRNRTTSLLILKFLSDTK